MNAKRIWLLLTLAVWLCVAAVACGDGAEVARVTETSVPPPTAEFTVTPIAEPSTAAPAPQAPATLPEGPAAEFTPIIPTDTPMPTPTLTPELPSRREVFDDYAQEFFVSAGANGPISFCMVAPAPELLPTAEMSLPGYDSGEFCLWGFPAGSPVNVELYDPRSRLVAAREIEVYHQREGVGAVLFGLLFVGQPRGDWTLVANSGGMGLTASFHLGKSSIPVISIIPPGSDPFTADEHHECFLQYTYAVGDEVAILGSGFPPRKSLPLGIYYPEEQDFPSSSQMIYGQEVLSDEQGRFEVHMPVETLALQGDGIYFAIVPLDPGYQPGYTWHGAECPGPPWLSPQGAIAGFVVGSGAGDTTP